nr:NADH dehydrogenase subunit 4L [Metschnikowia bicuspidata]
MLTMMTMLLIMYMSPNNMMSLLMGMEMLLLMVTVKMMYLSGNYDDMHGTMNSLYIMMLAGAESAMGLSLLVSYYRLRGKVSNQT